MSRHYFVTRHLNVLRHDVGKHALLAKWLTGTGQSEQISVVHPHDKDYSTVNLQTVQSPKPPLFSVELMHMIIMKMILKKKITCLSQKDSRHHLTERVIFLCTPNLSQEISIDYRVGWKVGIFRTIHLIQINLPLKEKKI